MNFKLNKQALVSASLAAGVLGWVAYGVTGCELIASVDRTKIGNNTGGGGAGTGGNGGNPSTGGGGTGGTGGMMCVDAECNGNASDCRAPGCVNDECGFVNEDAGTACDDGVANAAVCDGAGDCVLCNESADCTFDANLTICSNNVCVNAACGNGVLDGEETGLDDGGTPPLHCGGSACGPCVEGEGCNVIGDCLSDVCDTTAGAGGAGGGVAVGSCVVCEGNTGTNSCVAAKWCDSTDSGGRCKDDKAGGLGNACNVGTFTGSAQCVSNQFCVDTFCCDTACNADCERCDAAASLAGDGVCGAVDTAVDADPDTDCNGGNTACEDGTCGGKGVCNNPGAGTTCRNGSGLGAGGGNTVECDPPDLCTGVDGAACPANTNFLANSTVCNAGSGDSCDPDTMCPGSAGTACGPDVFSTNAIQCRAAGGDCGLAENCPGVPNQQCDADIHVAEGQNPGTASNCPTGCCNGTGPTVPGDCLTGNCDDGETCDAAGDCENGSCGGASAGVCE